MAGGFKNFAAGAVLGESDLDDYLMRQSAMVFADSAARDTALSGVLVEGMVAVLKDVDTVTMYTGAAWITVAHYAAATTWTPTVTQNALPTMTVNHATYQRQGKMVTGSFNVVVASGTGTASNVVSVTTPTSSFSGAGVNDVIGTGFIYDSSATTKYRAILVISGITSMQLLTLHSTSDNYLGLVDFTAALAVNDILSGTFHYESA